MIEELKNEGSSPTISTADIQTPLTVHGRSPPHHVDIIDARNGKRSTKLNDATEFGVKKQLCNSKVRAILASKDSTYEGAKQKNSPISAIALPGYAGKTNAASTEQASPAQNDLVFKLKPWEAEIFPQTSSPRNENRFQVARPHWQR